MGDRVSEDERKGHPQSLLKHPHILSRSPFPPSPPHTHKCTHARKQQNHWLIVDMHSSPLVNTCGTLAAALPNCAAQIDPVPSP